MKQKEFYTRNLTKEQLDLKRNRENCEHELKKNGTSSSGNQKYYCKKCGATLCYPEKSNRMTWKEIKQIFILEQRENLSIRKIAKCLGYSPSTILENKNYWNSVCNQEMTHLALCASKYL